MEYPNQKAKLSNGGTILIEGSIEKDIRLITAHYPLSNDPYVVWHMNTWDRSAYWGHYYSHMANAFDYFTKTYIKKLSIELNNFKSFLVKSCCWNEEIKEYKSVNVNVCDLFCVYGLTNDDISKLLTIHYTSSSATMYGYWLSNQFNKHFLNQVIGKFGNRLTTCNYVT